MSGSGTLVKYSYLADGSKREAVSGSGAGLAYKGSLIYRLSSANSSASGYLTTVPSGMTFRYLKAVL